MLGSITAIADQIVNAAGSVVGYRRGVEEPVHSAQNLTRGVQIRHYDARVAAETAVQGGEEAARSVGFRRLARYIFGANHVQKKIEMTAPVAQQSKGGEKIAMTAPVVQQADGDEWTIRFFMPSDFTLESLPAPDDAQVRLVSVPAETIAVRRFAGSPTRRAVAAQTAKLLTTLSEFGFETLGTPAAWFYDPPWTVPALRRNEIAVLVEPGPGTS